MAAMASRAEPKLALEIRTKSVEQTLIPLVTQITTLVNHRDKPIKSERTLRALVRVGQAVSLAVERFVTVGESIAEENPDIRHDMREACKEAKMAGTSIQKLTDVKVEDVGSQSRALAEKTAMVRAARQLLSAITKVLILADKVVVKELVAAKDQVSNSLNHLEMVTGFTDFVKAFSQFGNDMVKLAHVSGDRQNDLKSDKARAQMAVTRSILEKSTMMLLTSSKTYLRHPDTESSRQNRDAVFVQTRKALESIHQLATDGAHVSGDVSPSTTVNGDSGISLAQHQPTASRAMKDFEDLVEMTRVTLLGSNSEAKLLGALETLIETTQDFTDSAYTSHENRERILVMCERLRQELATLSRVGHNVNPKDSASPSQEMESAIIHTKDACRTLKKQLQDTALDQASEVFKSSEDHALLSALKSAGLNGEKERVNELSVKFEEHSEQLQEVCKLLRHIAGTETLVVMSEHSENQLKNLCPSTIQACRTLAYNSLSKIAKENVDVFSDAWACIINELSVLVKDINDVCQGKSDRQVYMSLPRPGIGHVGVSRRYYSIPVDRKMVAECQGQIANCLGPHLTNKHGTTAKSIRPVKLSAEEQAKIAKLGLEMKLITSEMDAEAEKWDDPHNEIVRRAKNMSSMAFAMYLFTRGEGPLKTTQDLFTQAEYFAEEGVKLFKIVKDFSMQVPGGVPRTELTAALDKLPVLCHQLNFTLKAPTMGKAATFNKVDSVIQDTKNLMNAIAKVVTASFICATKYNIDYRGSSPHHKWRPLPVMDMHSNGGGGVGGPGSDSSDRSDRESIKSSSSRSDKVFHRSSSLNTKPMSNFERL